jgi:Lrp/AsnC family transcriptional regulator for asnA, asnC and gidA
MEAGMDELDLQILDALQEDGRMPFTQIAKRTGVSESTIRSRYTSLVEEGIIQVIAVIDPFACDFHAPALVGIAVEPGMIDAVAAALKQIPEVSYLVMTLGAHDLVVELFCRNTEHLTDVITGQIRTISGVRRTETWLTSRIYKLSYFWSPEEGHFRDETFRASS